MDKISIKMNLNVPVGGTQYFFLFVVLADLAVGLDL